ncbi:MAG TPA: hypothetical protein VE934_17785 [Polaromonas sp.]|uniref:hypothetical protein n=1 Tax=Polaromonas sp. TaxID=1869339 RepID=UPI002D22A976|nr:hypothetical protein [Polaromonas sp.]HYW58806.1 hypothetical protein [Polaromonas sp.]
MATFKNTFEETRFIIEKVTSILVWASSSAVKRLILLSLLGAFLLTAQYLYLTHLLNATKKSGENRARETESLSKEHRYKAALDSITLCTDSKKEKQQLQVWYCQKAIVEYKQVSTEQLQDHVNEVANKLAYGAMRNDVSRYIRYLEFDRLLHSPATKEEELLNLLISKTVIGLWVFGLALLMTGAYFLLWILPKRRSLTLLTDQGTAPPVAETSL